MIDAAPGTTDAKGDRKVTMSKQSGASLLFLVLIVALAVIVATWTALPWIEATRKEKVERALNSGVTPAAKATPAKAAPPLSIEETKAAEFAAMYSRFEKLVGTDRYDALSQRCRGLVNGFVELVQNSSPASTVGRDAAVELGHTFDAECADSAAAK